MKGNWLKRLDSVISWLVVYFVIALIWVGAEYAFEGDVHASYVDAIVCGVLSTFVSFGIHNKE